MVVRLNNISTLNTTNIIATTIAATATATTSLKVILFVGIAKYTSSRNC